MGAIYYLERHSFPSQEVETPGYTEREATYFMGAATHNVTEQNVHDTRQVCIGGHLVQYP